MKTLVGIDDIAVYVPRLYLELADEQHPERPTEFSRARESDPAKYLHGIGIAKMSIPDTYQDSSVLAANAIFELIERNNLSPANIARIDIATETGVDESKPVAAYVHGMLEQKFGKGSFKKTSGVEYKFACVSTADALESSLDWAWAGRSKGRSSIVCSTDIAKYPLKTPGEPTQGAGAVALLVREGPRLLSFDNVIGTYMEDEDDFWRPLFSTTAIVHGKHSEKCYLKAMEGAVDDWAEQAEAARLISAGPGESLVDHVGPMSFHVPYPKMAEKGFAYLLRHFWRGLPRWTKGVDLAGRRGGSGNYGSGSKAKVSSWVFQEGWNEVARKFSHSEKLQHRRPVSLIEYEALHEVGPLPDGRKFVAEPENEFVLIDVTPQGYRHYKFAD